MHTVIEILKLSTEFLKQKGIENSRRQAEDLLGDALGVGRMGLYLEHDRPLTESELNKCREWLKRRGNGEPLQYIAGKVEFFGCSLIVTPEVLIPRQETEILIDKIVQKLSTIDLEGKILWDVCCGSGCIGIALKKKFPKLHVALSDISAEALAVAKKNGIDNDVEVDYFCGDLLVPFAGRRADFIVSNPPYIAEREYATLDIEVRNYEPKGALISGPTGLEFYKRLAEELPCHLTPKGRAWFEIGTGQGEAIKRLFSSPCWVNCGFELDWSGRERFFSLEIE
ncbi:MAG: peptide chain release factor N(5)-glutamine methyltransferase [Parachlamydiaceae bacterium]